METPKHYVKSVERQKYRHHNNINDVVLVSLFLTLNRFEHIAFVFALITLNK